MFHVSFRPNFGHICIQDQDAQETDSHLCRTLIKDGLGGFFGALKYHLHLGRAERVQSLDMEEGPIKDAFAASQKRAPSARYSSS